MRTTNINITQEQFGDLAMNVQKIKLQAYERAVEADDRAAMRKLDTETGGFSHTQQAIGYLATWSLPDDGVVNPYVRCDIFVSDIGETGQPELVACYYRATPSSANRPDYVIGAIWHETHWGFHS